jgi:hypothetical protein
MNTSTFESAVNDIAAASTLVIAALAAVGIFALLF